MMFVTSTDMLMLDFSRRRPPPCVTAASEFSTSNSPPVTGKIAAGCEPNSSRAGGIAVMKIPSLSSFTKFAMLTSSRVSCPVTVTGAALAGCADSASAISDSPVIASDAGSAMNPTRGPP